MRDDERVKLDAATDPGLMEQEVARARRMVEVLRAAGEWDYTLQRVLTLSRLVSMILQQRVLLESQIEEEVHRMVLEGLPTTGSVS